VLLLFAEITCVDSAILVVKKSCSDTISSMVRPLPPSNNSNNKILSANHRPSASLLRGRFLEGVDKTTDNSSNSSSRQPWRRRHSRSGSISENWGDNDYEAPLKRPVSVDLEELDVREQDIKQRHQQQSLNDCNEPTTTNNNKALRGKGILRFLGGKVSKIRDGTA
jgi:hypothetical protein